jgi:hypothetical protein
MPKTSPDAYGGLVVAALVLVLVLVVSFMSLQLYGLRKEARLAARGPSGPFAASEAKAGGAVPTKKEPFITTLYYSPSCGSEWMGRRRSECRGITTGVMPSIELTTNFGHTTCSGRLGVPP